jgi:uncharacterized protein YcsI (UPF0317 family)
MSMQTTLPEFTSASDLRSAIRRGEFRAPTAGQAAGHVQTNLVILPAVDADDFERFCRENDRPCPLVERTAPGDFVPRRSAPAADLRTDVPRYRVFRDGMLADEPTDIRNLWRDDLVGFLIGCSFTFETALNNAGLAVRHIEEGRNVPMYRTSVPCRPAGKFAGPLVVSMRPYLPEQIPQVIEITGRFPTMHGAPLHVGDPSVLGIADLARPDFGDAVTVRDGEIPVFWACGVTPQLALAAARPALAITHSPGYMFVTDLKDTDFLVHP